MTLTWIGLRSIKQASVNGVWGFRLGIESATLRTWSSSLITELRKSLIRAWQQVLYWLLRLLFWGLITWENFSPADRLEISPDYMKYFCPG